MIVADNPPPFKTASHTLTWADDPEAKLHFALKEDAAYIVDIRRGQRISGSQILQAFQSIAENRRIKVLGVDFPTIGFWEKMMARNLVQDWGMQNPKMML